jgi:hypothetical protein
MLCLSSLLHIHIQTLPYNAEKLVEYNYVQKTKGWYRPTQEGWEVLESIKNTPISSLPLLVEDIKTMLMKIPFPNTDSIGGASELVSWEKLDLVGSDCSDPNKKYLTRRGFETVQFYAKELVKDIQDRFDYLKNWKSLPSDYQRYCQSLVKLVNPDLWAIILPSSNPKTATYFAELLRQSRENVNIVV